MIYKLNQTVVTSEGPIILTEVDTILGKYYAIINIETKKCRTIGTCYEICITNFNNYINNLSKRAI